MKKLTKRILSILMCAVMVLTIAPLSGIISKVSAETTSNFSWTFDKSTGLLEISGNGDIVSDSGEDGNEYTYRMKHQNEIKTIKINKGITGIGEGAFSNIPNLKAISIPDTVTWIGSWAFMDCASLTSITIPKSVENISDMRVFYGCKSLNNITVFDGLNNLSASTFYECAYYNNEKNWVDGVLYIGNYLVTAKPTIPVSYKIKDGTKYIVNSAFYFNSCEDLEEIKIPESVISIGSMAFYECSSLKKIEIPDTVEIINTDAFYDTAYYNDQKNWVNGVLYVGNHLIKANETISGSYKINNGTKTIADYAFSWCDKLTNITISDSITSIGNFAFAGCTSFTSITIPNSVTHIGEGSFSYCIKLKDIKLSNRLTTIGDFVFENCTYLKNVTIPEGIKSTGNYMFLYCTALTNVSLPKSLVNIGERTFDTCSSLKSITIPNNVKTIGDGAFWNCRTLEKVTIPTSLTTIEKSAFGGDNCLTDIYYKGSKTNWNKIKISEGNENLTNATIHYNYGASNTGLASVTTKLISIANTVNGPQLKWNAVSGATGYYVYRKTSGTSWTRIGTTSSTSFIDKTAKAGTTYTYTAKAYKGSTASKFESGKTIKYMAAPKIASVTNSVNGPYMTWNKVAGASGYQVYRKTGANGTWTKIATVTATNYRDTKAKSGTTYYYSVKSYSGKTVSSMRAGTAIKFLSAPTVSSVTNSTTGPYIKWNKVAGASGYQVYRKTGANGTWTKIATVTATNYKDTKAKSGTTYYYSVKSYSGKTLSSMRAGTKLLFLASPTVKVATASNGLKITWNKVAGATSYQVYRKTGSNGTWSVIKTVKTTTYTDTTAKKNTTYYYTVKSVNGKTTSSMRAGIKGTRK